MWTYLLFCDSFYTCCLRFETNFAGRSERGNSACGPRDLMKFETTTSSFPSFFAIDTEWHRNQWVSLSHTRFNSVGDHRFGAMIDLTS